MAINKLPEFAKDGQKNTDDLVLTDGFPVLKKPARQWFNYLFNMLSLKINELIDLDPISKTEIIDNLTTDDANKVASAKQVKILNDDKANKTTTLTAGNGLSGGGTLEANRTLTLGTPSKITGSTTNSVTATSHTHEIDNASTSVAGVVKLNNTLTSTSTTEALTAAQGKILNDQAFGVGVDYYDVTAQRVKGTIYTATGFKPRMLIINIESSGGSSTDILFVRKNDLSPWMPIAQRGSGSRTIFPIILPGYQYKYESPANFTKWIEVY